MTKKRSIERKRGKEDIAPTRRERGMVMGNGGSSYCFSFSNTETEKSERGKGEKKKGRAGRGEPPAGGWRWRWREWPCFFVFCVFLNFKQQATHEATSNKQLATRCSV